MKKSLIVLGVVVVIIIGFFSMFKGNYNNLVSREEGVSSAWSNVENQYQRRSDLIPNLVNSVKGYATHESQTLESVIAARASATKVTLSVDQLNEQSLAAYNKAQGEVSSALSRLMAVSENYPDLKANQNFLDLQAQLEGTENRISTERMRFNETVQGYNTYLRQFPQNIIASMFGFEPKAYFQADESSKDAPVVEF